MTATEQELVAPDVFEVTSPFAYGIDSSVEYSGGVWFSKGHWAMKTDKNLKDGYDKKKCAPFWTDNYWQALKGRFNYRMDACVWMPNIDNRSEGFWVFEASKAVRVTADGKSVKIGPFDITDKNLFPKTKDTVFSGGVDAAAHESHTSDSVKYLFFRFTGGKHYIGVYTWKKKESEHSLTIKEGLSDKFPRFPFADRPIGSVLELGDYWYFFVSHDIEEAQAFGHHKTDTTGNSDIGPSPISEVVPVIKTDYAKPS
ncbi:hypothetical protein [Saccharopolyspora taberi]|uniref:Uncharacterized protein n=1 Tax=Saccharopolyspora taberi TaxID=60895 RepID=A0ABN3VMD8_9PSEU